MEKEKWTWHFIFHLSFLIWKYNFFVMLILNVQRGLEKTGIWSYIVAWRCGKIWQYGAKDVWEYKQSVAQWLSSVSASSPLLLPKPCLFHCPVYYSSRLQWLDRVSFHELFVTFTVGFPFHMKAWGKRFWSQESQCPQWDPGDSCSPFSLHTQTYGSQILLKEVLRGRSKWSRHSLYYWQLPDDFCHSRSWSIPFFRPSLLYVLRTFLLVL